jgi:hypothetical protein
MSNPEPGDKVRLTPQFDLSIFPPADISIYYETELVSGAQTLTSVSITPETINVGPQDSHVVTFTATVVSTATDLVYDWSSNSVNSSIVDNGDGTATVTVTDTPGAAPETVPVDLTVSSVNAGASVSDGSSIFLTNSIGTIGNVSMSPAGGTAANGSILASLVVSHTGTANSSDLTYTWSTSDSSAVLPSPRVGNNTNAIVFGTDDANTTITCVVSAAGATDSPQSVTETWVVGSPSSDIPTLPDGGVDINSWDLFSFGADGDGQGLNIAADTTDVRINDQEIPGRFVTPWKNDIDDTEFIDVLVHPYSGVDDEGDYNSFKVWLYLNGGSKVEAKPRTRPSLQGLDPYTVYSAKLPSGLTGDNEVRCVIVPDHGTPKILQRGVDPSNRFFSTTYFGTNPDNYVTYPTGSRTAERGVFIHEYNEVTVGPSGTYATVQAAITGEGAYNLKCVLTGSSYDEADIFTFQDCVYSTDGDQNLTGTRAMPYITSDGTGTIIASSMSVTNNMLEGMIIKNCNVYVKPDPTTTPATRDSDIRCSAVSTGAFSFRQSQGSYFHYEGCTMGIKQDTTYTPNGAGAQSLVDEGLSTLVQLWDLGLGFKNAAIATSVIGGDGGGTLTHVLDCEVKLSVCPSDEVVDSICICPPAGHDVWNAKLGVNAHEAGVNELMYPWGSNSQDVVSAAGGPFSFDYAQESYGGSSTYEYANVQANMDDPATAVNVGIWPDFVGLGNTTNVMVGDGASLFFGNGDGTYTDHHGWTTTGWSTTVSGGDGGVRKQTINGGQDPHFDSYQFSNRGWLQGSLMINSCTGYGDQTDRQWIYFSNSSANSLAVWGNRAQQGVSAQVTLSVGLWGNDLEVHTNGQHWGPGYWNATEPTPDGSTETQSLRDYLQLQPYSVTSSGFIYAATTDPNADEWVNDVNIVLDGFEPVSQQPGTLDGWYYIRTDLSGEYLATVDIEEDSVSVPAFSEISTANRTLVAVPASNQTDLVYSWTVTSSDGDTSDVVNTTGSSSSFVLGFTAADPSKIYTVEVEVSSAAISKTVSHSVTYRVVPAIEFPVTFSGDAADAGSNIFEYDASLGTATWEDNNGVDVTPVGLKKVFFRSFLQGVTLTFDTTSDRDTYFNAKYAGKQMSLEMNSSGSASDLTGPIVIGGNGQLTTYDSSPAIQFATAEWDSFQNTSSGTATRPFVITFS